MSPYGLDTGKSLPEGWKRGAQAECSREDRQGNGSNTPGNSQCGKPALRGLVPQQPENCQ